MEPRPVDRQILAPEFLRPNVHALYSGVRYSGVRLRVENLEGIQQESRCSERRI